MDTKEAIENIFTINLAVKEGERVLVFTDIGGDVEGVTGIRDVAIKVAEVGRTYCDIIYTEFPSTGCHGTEPPKELWQAAMGEAAVGELEEGGLLDRILRKTATPEDIAKAETIIEAHCDDCVSAVVALSRYSTSHTRFRGLLAKAAGVRYASMPNFEAVMLEGVMTADWREIEERTVRLAEMLNGAGKVSVTTPNGTSISFSIEGRAVKPDTGILTEPGTFGNLPAGEAFVAPVEGTAEGVLIIDWG
ncbi:MAG: peptidase, partial [Deltaproteobacteria bacterium]|nr:peptidase [Deltaproteobacteria bacterium]